MSRGPYPRRPDIARGSACPGCGRSFLTAKGIADVAGVHISAVSNWRARGLGFPDQALPGLWDAHAVRQWLSNTGRATA